MVSEFADMLCIDGKYIDPENAENSFEYMIFLRPWGMRWDDVAAADTTYMICDDMTPIEYTNWYLPLIEAGEPMPDSFEGLPLLRKEIITHSRPADSSAGRVLISPCSRLAIRTQGG